MDRYETLEFVGAIPDLVVATVVLIALMLGFSHCDAETTVDRCIALIIIMIVYVSPFWELHVAIDVMSVPKSTSSTDVCEDSGADDVVCEHRSDIEVPLLCICHHNATSIREHDRDTYAVAPHIERAREIER